jgi:hypothetical protein
VLRLLAGLGLFTLLSACAPSTQSSEADFSFTPSSYYDLQVLNSCDESLEVYIDGYYATTVARQGVISGISAGQHELYAEGYTVSPFSRQFYFDANHEWVLEC